VWALTGRRIWLPGAKIPVASLSGVAVKIAPGAYALVQLVTKIFFIKHR
jgi:hypothetical protein